MQKIENDWLLDILLKCRKRPALLTGVQSFRALENYINGYIDACRQFDVGSLTLKWYDEFMLFLAKKLSVKDEFFSVAGQLQELGYTDEDGAVYFLELLEQFLDERCDFVETKKRASELTPGEVRVFRLGSHKQSDLFVKQIRNNAAEYFGVEITEEDTLTVIETDDGGVICALSKGRYSLDILEEAFSRLPTIGAAERIQYEVFFL